MTCKDTTGTKHPAPNKRQQIIEQECCGSHNKGTGDDPPELTQGNLQKWKDRARAKGEWRRQMNGVSCVKSQRCGRKHKRSKN